MAVGRETPWFLPKTSHVRGHESLRRGPRRIRYIMARQIGAIESIAGISEQLLGIPSVASHEAIPLDARRCSLMRNWNHVRVIRGRIDYLRLRSTDVGQMACEVGLRVRE